jgi:hypothetical protein
MERESLQVFLYVVFHVSALCDTADVNPINHFRQYPLQNITILWQKERVLNICP